MKNANDLINRLMEYYGVYTLTELSKKLDIGQLTYKMSKNLNTYVRYGKVTEKNVSGDKTRDENRGRIQVAYTF